MKHKIHRTLFVIQCFLGTSFCTLQLSSIGMMIFNDFTLIALSTSFKITTIILIIFAIMHILSEAKYFKSIIKLYFVEIIVGTLLSFIVLYLDWLFIKRLFYFKANILTTSFFEVFINIAIFSIINVLIMALPELLFKKDKKCKKRKFNKKTLTLNI